MVGVVGVVGVVVDMGVLVCVVWAIGDMDICNNPVAVDAVDAEVDLVDIDGIGRGRSWCFLYILFTEYKNAFNFFILYLFNYLIIKIRTVANFHSAVVFWIFFIIDWLVNM